eukprot:Tamp_21336.p1 GENE.Tamp_21336~~Tamp_21336.p1  ORF type:complete len:349 (+),score=64.46 Tamp_21336:46-1092(+)
MIWGRARAAARGLAVIGVGVFSTPRGAMCSTTPSGSCSAAERCLGAIKTGLVADAASMGLHWIYDVEKIKTLTKGVQHPEFFEPPSCPFYKYEPGQLSPYGAEALGVLRILANSKNQEFDAQEFAVELKDYLKAYPGRLNHASKELIAAIDSGKSFPACGADDSQANSLVKAALAVAAFQGRDDWALRAEDVMRAHQNNEIAIKFGMGAAHIVHRILRGSSIRDALAWAVSPDSPLDAEVKASAKTAAEFGTNHTCQEAAAAFGSSCALPAAFRVCIHLLSKDLPFEEAVRQNILAGGDQCSRAVFVGACYGAALGEAVVPAAWTHKVSDMPEIDGLARLLIAPRSKL